MTTSIQRPTLHPAFHASSPRFAQQPKPFEVSRANPDTASPLSTDVLAQTLKAQRLKSPKIRFGFNLPYDGVYDHVVAITDFNDLSSNTRAEAAFWQSLKFAQINRLRNQALPGFEFNPNIVDPLNKEFKTAGDLKLHSITDVPGGNTSFAALQLNELGDALAGRKVVFHVTDPGVGNGENGQHDRSILITPDHVFVGPNNGSLGLYIKTLQKKNKPFSLYQIDINKVQAYERLRLNDPNYETPGIYHGRDLFAPVAGAIAGGIKPEAFVVSNQEPGTFIPKTVPFSDTKNLADLKVGDSLEFYGVQDNTFENIKSNLTLSASEHRHLVEQGAVFEVVNADEPTQKLAEIPLKNRFSEVRAGKPVAYLGSHYETFPQRRFVEFALNLSTINGTQADADFDGRGAAGKLGIDKIQPQRLLLRRVS